MSKGLFRVFAAALLAAQCFTVHASVLVTDVQALLRSVPTPNGTRVELLADAEGQIATSIIEYPPDPITPTGRSFPAERVFWAMGVEPTPFMPVLSFDFDDTGNFSGVQPTPFQLFSVATGEFFGTLSFDAVTDAQLGSVRNITGAILTETIFSWPGIGKWMVASVVGRDYPVIQGGILLICSLVITVNILVDLSYGVINPRLRTGANN